MTRDEILEALRPFAEEARSIGDSVPDDALAEFRFAEDDGLIELEPSEFRNARRVYDALSAQPAGEPSELPPVDCTGLFDQPPPEPSFCHYDDDPPIEFVPRNPVRRRFTPEEQLAAARAAGFKAAKERESGGVLKQEG